MDQHRRVLVIDDEPSVRRLLAVALRKRSLVVDEASDGAEAIALLAENRYSVVLLDLLMPKVDGFGVIDAIGDGANPIVLVLSGADRRVLDQVDSRKVHGIVRKPFDPLEIADVVSAIAEIRGRSTFEAMAFVAVMVGAPLIALLEL
jgi:DNA-binding response OmpR family regulator